MIWYGENLRTARSEDAAEAVETCAIDAAANETCADALQPTG